MSWLKGFLIGYGMGLLVFSLLAAIALAYLFRIGLDGISS